VKEAGNLTMGGKAQGPENKVTNGVAVVLIDL